MRTIFPLDDNMLPKQSLGQISVPKQKLGNELNKHDYQALAGAMALLPFIEG
jgi:hypothetical protein